MKSAKVIIHYKKSLERKRKKNSTLKKRTKKKTEISLNDPNNLGKYNSIKNELNAIYDHTASCI